ncbi:uncharacterized protein LOC122012785 [Zingiber officinale]|uniref:Uncharacterized protein n=1 Tax=Zingiber officinale TaxID=94328 RepID=A0A8J5KSV7_ZINOF|nr:uncharacterized protein LOC122012785 [Zingiber officinale]KAG6487970.1 hypothetical protein ZIOFF_056728 [Zingiber officinale]
MLLPSPSSSAEHRQRSNFPAMAAAKICFQRPVDSLRRKLKKPLFKGDARVRRRRGAGWWRRSALLFWKQTHQGTRAAGSPACGGALIPRSCGPCTSLRAAATPGSRGR